MLMNAVYVQQMTDLLILYVLTHTKSKICAILLHEFFSLSSNMATRLMSRAMPSEMFTVIG